MIRLLVPSFGALVAICLWIYALLDVIQTDEILVRNLPKVVWLLLVVFVPLVGSVAWLVAGRPLYAGWAPGGAQSQGTRQRYVPLEDRPGWSSAPPTVAGPTPEQLQRWEDDLARRERELQEPPDADPDETPSA